MIGHRAHLCAQSPVIRRNTRGSDLARGDRQSDKTRALQVFPVRRSWVRALFGSVRSTVQIRAPRFFPANRLLFTLRFAVCWSPQKLKGTYGTDVCGSQKCWKSARSTAIVGTTGRTGEVHRSRTAALARKDLLIRMFSLLASGPRLASCAQSVPKPRERGRVCRRWALMVPGMIASRSLAPAFVLGAALAVDWVESSAGVPLRERAERRPALSHSRIADSRA
jgi:hypothetical protein